MPKMWKLSHALNILINILAMLCVMKWFFYFLMCFRLSEVSPVVREALAMPASEEYLATLTAELGLQEQDLADLVGGFKTPAQA